MNSRFIAHVVVLAGALPFVACVDDRIEPLGPALQQASRVAGAHYEVGFTYYMIQDASRNRPIPVYVWYPIDAASVTDETLPAQYPLEPFADQLPVMSSLDFEEAGMGAAWQDVPAAEGPFPLIMFSPGLGAPAYASAMFLATAIVQHGFVVASVTHWGDRAAPVPVPGEPGHGLAVTSYNRPRDISFVLTDLLDKNAAASGLLSGVIDPSMIYASGWALGGYASVVLAAGDDGVCDRVPGPASVCGPTAPDPRIKAIMPLDGSYQLMTFEELARVAVPALAIGEEWDNAKAWMGGLEAWQARAHAAFSGSPSYRVEVSRVLHPAFANLCESFAVLEKYQLPTWPPFFKTAACSMMSSAELHRIVNQYVLAFLTHQQAFLTPGFALVREPDVEFYVTERRSPQSIDVDQPSLFVYFMHQQGRGHADDVTATAEKNPAGPIPSDGYGIRRLTDLSQFD